MDEFYTCSCDACCRDERMPKGEMGEKGQVLSIAVSVLFFLAALLLPIPDVYSVPLYLIAYLAAGREVLLRAGSNLLHGKLLDEHFLMSIASAGAFVIGEYPEGVAVMLLYQVGEFLQSLAVDRSRRSISELMDIRPDRAVRVDGDSLKECAAAEIIPGDLILVRPGERIALDGVVEDGKSQLDTSALTGESFPRETGPQSEVLAGFINLSGTLDVRVTKPYGESTASKILELVEKAASNKAKAEQFITKFSRYYTPAVVGIAVLIALLPPLLAGGAWSGYLHRALVFLVISCPCALVLSVPMGYFAGVGAASKNGILVKGGNYLEALCRAETVVFDKTGTLTDGKLQVVSILPAALDSESVFEYAAYAEAQSSHPIARSIVNHYIGEIEKRRIGAAEELPGKGIRAVVDGKTVLAGNRGLLEAAGIPVPDPAGENIPVYLAVDGVFAGTVLMGNIMKKEAPQVMRELNELGVRKTVMLTGDSREEGERVGREAGVDEVHAQLLPDEKVAWVETIGIENGRRGVLLFIGDGINDAPALARADVGIALGGLGSDAAIEAADVVIMDDRLERIPQAIRIARRTRAIVVQNVLLILLVKLLFLTLGGFGLATMWEAVFADVGVSVLAVFNSLRALRAPKAPTAA